MAEQQDVAGDGGRKATWPVALAALMLALAAVSCGAPASAQDDMAAFRWAGDGDALSLDPETRNEVQQLALTGNIYEPLVRFGVDGNLEPGLAVSWENPTPLEWIFHLRAQVRWQDGTKFSADDVLFSLARVLLPASLLRPIMARVVAARRIDDLTVALRTATPDPILPREATIWYILSKAWCGAHQAEVPALLSAAQRNFATLHAMGTGPYRLVTREPQQRTEFARNPTWWGQRDGDPDRVIFEAIPADATRTAALLAGDVDLITNVPPPDAERVAKMPGLHLEARPEDRTIFLGMDQSRDELLHSDVKGRNPFRDKRVREAIALAIDETAITTRLMHGHARPTWLLWGPGVQGYDAALDHRPAPDLARAKTLLSDAGFPNGFQVTIDCPNDRYVMDDQICTSLAPMLARIGIRLRLNIQPKARFFAQIGPPGYDTSFYLLGWTPTTRDAHNVLMNLLETRDGVHGAINFGGFSDPRIDRLTEQVATEMQPAARDRLIAQAARLAQDDFAYIPLHQQELIWGMRDGIEAGQPADGMLMMHRVHRQAGAPTQ